MPTFSAYLRLCCSVLAIGCAPHLKDVKTSAETHDPPFVATQQLSASMPTATPLLIKNGTLWTAEDDEPEIKNGWLFFLDGKIDAMGRGEPPAHILAKVKNIIDAKQRYVTPGLVDTHSHLGVYASPRVWAHSDGNEMTNPVTSGIRAEDAFWPQDPGIERAVGGGVTTIHVLPGSGNLMGGQGFSLKLHPRREVAAMKIPDAKNSLKMACGENPKRVYGKNKRMPMSRMGSIYLMRKTWLAAQRYREKWARWQKHKRAKDKPRVDLNLQTLSDVLDGKILVQIHCYRADEMLQQIKLSREFGYPIRSFHHAVEAYKIRDILKRENISVSTWADWWGFKIEAYDAIEENLALLESNGTRAILHTDSPEGIQRMNQEAAKALSSGRRGGIDLSDHQALKWITINAAWVLGLEDKLGSLKVGKDADVVIWDRYPLSVYASAAQVFVDGHLRKDKDSKAPHWSDFEVSP